MSQQVSDDWLIEYSKSVSTINHIIIGSDSIMHRPKYKIFTFTFPFVSSKFRTTVACT